MGQSFIETTLAGDLDIRLHRRKNADGTFSRSAVINFVILDAAGVPIKQYERNLSTFLLPGQIIALNNFMDNVINRVLSQFAVTDS